jgi:hypothetical protein
MDVIWSQLKVDTADAKKSIQSFNTEVIKSERTVKHAGDAGTIAFNKQATAVKGATDAQRKLQSESTKTGSTFSNAINKTAGSLGNISGSLGQIAAGLGIAFGTQQVIAFGKEAIAQFAEAELNAKKLSFAVKNIAGDSEASFNRLMAQSGNLQGVSIFSDDDIQRAQTALLQYGLTTDQVEKLIPAIVDLASATGEDLSSAQDRVLNGINGQTKGLKDVGLQFKDTGDKTKNFEIILDGLNNKFTGATADALDTTAGKIANLKNQFGEIQESLGGEILTVVSEMVAGIQAIGGGETLNGLEDVTTAFQKITGIIQVLPNPIGGVMKAFKDVIGAVKEFRDGNILKGIGKIYEGIANTITFGLYGSIKKAIVGTEELADQTTDYEKRINEIILATDDQIQKQRELLVAQGQSTEEFDKYVQSVRESQIVKTFEELANVLEITKEQYKELTDISDKYGRSAAINSSLILDISKATNDQLEVAFAKFNQTLGVTRKDFDDYIGQVKQIPPIQKEIGDSVKANLIGPYDALTKSLGDVTKKMYDYLTLSKDATLLDRQRFEIQKEINRVQAEYTALVNSHNPVQKDNNDLTIRSAESQKILFDALVKTLEPMKVLPFSLKEINDATDEQKKSIEELIAEWQEAANIAGALAQLGESLNSALTQIFGEAAEKNAVFAAFQKAITIATITFKSIEAVANGVAAFSAGVTGGDPTKIIGGIASIVAGIGNLIGGLVQQVNAVQTPSAPSFFDGTGDTGPGGNVDSRGGFWSILHPHEGILNAKGNKAFSGLAEAVNMGKGEDYMMRHVAGKLIQQRQSDLIEQAEKLLLESKNEFDDKRLYKNGTDHTYLLKQNNVLLARMLKDKSNPWTV